MKLIKRARFLDLTFPDLIMFGVAVSRVYEWDERVGIRVRIGLGAVTLNLRLLHRGKR